MNGKSAQHSKPLANYLRVKKLQIFPVLKRLDFSGQLTWSTPAGQQWALFFNRGQVVYGRGGVHPVRQWYRQTQARLPEADLSYQALQTALGANPSPSWLHDWDYHLLHNWLGQGQLSQRSLQTISANIVADILFDVVQAGDTQYHLTRHPALDPRQVPVYIDDTELLPSVTELWEAWLEVGLEAYSPNLAPVIQHPEPIQARVSPGVYASLMQLLDGQRSLRDLAVKLGQDVLNLTQALQPYIQAGWISLVEVADFPAIAGLDPPVAGHDQPKAALKIACVDDSPMVCKAMGQVIRAAGYEFLAITEGSKAIPTLLAQKPDLVFLDLVMPDTNGYEICSNLRKISRFKAVPIVILSGNDGLVDQVRARLLGATDFLSKPMEPIVILSVIRKHLAHARV
ncbi:MAG TPA: response regulator [Nodosilinea sp.]|nr:response regulator [Nodosilinea sp.]